MPYPAAHVPAPVPGNSTLTCCTLCADIRKTPFILRIPRCQATASAVCFHQVPPLGSAQDVAPLIFPKLDYPPRAHRTSEHTRLTLNETQAVMLQAMWEARNDSRDSNAPADLDRVSRHFGVSLRCCLRTIGRSLPHVLWTPGYRHRHCLGRVVVYCILSDLVIPFFHFFEFDL